MSQQAKAVAGVAGGAGAATVDGAGAGPGRPAAAHPLRPGVWRDFARLAAEGFTIGLLVSVLLATCVLMIAGSSRTPDREPTAGAHAPWTSNAVPNGEDRRGR
jgi:hypothetical protein